MVWCVATCASRFCRVRPLGAAKKNDVDVTFSVAEDDVFVQLLHGCMRLVTTMSHSMSVALLLAGNERDSLVAPTSHHKMAEARPLSAHRAGMYQGHR